MRRSLLATVTTLPGVDRLDSLTRRILAVTVVAIVARLAFLGARVSHFDEGRVGWWTLHYLDTGQFEYRFIIHGPFVQHVDRVVFGVLGANDFTLRLVVALVGAALPLAALLFRDRLRDDEVLGVALFLALNPLLVYYSRFFRSTLLVAGFSFVAFGLLVRALDERSVWHAHLAVVFVALAFAAKENAVVYLLCWLGAGALVLDHRLFRTGEDRAGLDWLLAQIPDHNPRPNYRERVPWYAGHLVLGGLIFVGISLFFYAPRSPDPNAVGLWQGVTNPAQFPTMFERTLDDVVTGYEYWFGGSTDAGCHKEDVISGYLCYLGRSLESLAQYALPLMILAIAGFLAERYARARSRMLVLFAGYWGFVSVLGYPLGTDIYGSWIMVNALVPLTIPAGVGLAMVVRWTLDALHGDAIRFGISVFLLVLIVGQVGFALADGVYLNPTEDESMAQFAQPADDFRPAMAVLDDRAETHDGIDVLFVGSEYVRDSPRVSGIEPRCTSISDTLPLQWYVGIHDAEGACAATVENATSIVDADRPLVVIAPESMENRLGGSLGGYEASTYRLRTHGNGAVFFVDRQSANATAG